MALIPKSRLPDFDQDFWAGRAGVPGSSRLRSQDHRYSSVPGQRFFGVGQDVLGFFPELILVADDAIEVLFLPDASGSGGSALEIAGLKTTSTNGGSGSSRCSPNGLTRTCI